MARRLLGLLALQYFAGKKPPSLCRCSPSRRKQSFGCCFFHIQIVGSSTYGTAARTTCLVRSLYKAAANAALYLESTYGRIGLGVRQGLYSKVLVHNFKRREGLFVHVVVFKIFLARPGRTYTCLIAFCSLMLMYKCVGNREKHAHVQEGNIALLVYKTIFILLKWF
jgi:hypothetical protein